MESANSLNTKFQLIKKYESGSTYDIRTITKPVNNTLKVYLQNEIISSSDYKVDYDKGIIEFLSPPDPEMEIFASFEFDVPVKFDNDYLPISIDNAHIYYCSNINLIEIKFNN